jgi:hypothetical protein
MLKVTVSERIKVRRLATTLKRFDHAYDQLAAAIADIDSDVNELIAKDYPFKQSFDELNVGQWVETCLDLIQSKLKQLSDEAKEAKNVGNNK